MILADVNLLVYAFDRSSPDHERARTWIDGARRRRELALCDPVTSGFIRLVTNPKIFGANATTAETASDFVSALAARHLAGGQPVVDELRSLAMRDRAIRANLVPDAWIAATALVHGARVATADAGFARFPRLVVINPLND